MLRRFTKEQMLILEESFVRDGDMYVCLGSIESAGLDNVRIVCFVSFFFFLLLLPKVTWTPYVSMPTCIIIDIIDSSQRSHDVKMLSSCMCC